MQLIDADSSGESDNEFIDETAAIEIEQDISQSNFEETVNNSDDDDCPEDFDWKQTLTTPSDVGDLLDFSKSEFLFQLEMYTGKETASQSTQKYGVGERVVLNLTQKIKRLKCEVLPENFLPFFRSCCHKF